MSKEEALALIDAHKNALINPVEMLRWTWLRVTISSVPDEMWNDAVMVAVETLSK